MTNILIKSAIALSLGVAYGPAFAQTEQPAQGQATECPEGTECPQGGAVQETQPDAQGGAAQTEQQSGAEQGAAETEGADPAQQPETDATQQQGQAESGTQQPAEGESQQQEGQTGTEQQPAEGETQQQEGQTTEQTTNVDVTVEQKTEITQVIREEKVEPIDVDFDVSVGVAIPETVKVKLRPLPERIVRIVPAYEGFLFFVLADGRIIIVHPSTLEIVLIIV
ncbi:hypothetical protein J2Z31_000369 [Sinorhizobium kostiense]|uniref:Exported glutamine-rich protein n=1 Tax=Sinorhizobium kostiense TaxID=76747 RepID=A0ABS4QV01_9HYPH|nr:DUF1236 domain-containing protein [Sinorhizobium kostiense]MBP2233879.1 hypothetical protein [Sinorhizobium kostiense]